MKAIRIEQYGGPEVLRLQDIPVPDPGAGEVLVRMAHAGINVMDRRHSTPGSPMARCRWRYAMEQISLAPADLEDGKAGGQAAARHRRRPGLNRCSEQV